MAQTIFGTEVPADTLQDDGVSYALGTKFQPQVDGQATHGEWYFPDVTPSQPVVIGIYRDSDQSLLGSATFAGTEAGGRFQVPFTPAINLTALTDYRVVVWTADNYVVTGGYFGVDKTSGDIYCPVLAGVYSENPPNIVWPNDTFGQANYWPDLVFQPGSAPDPAEGSVALDLNLAVSANGARDSEGSAGVGLDFSVSGTGARNSEGSAGLDLNFTVSVNGSAPDGGSTALGIGLAVAASGSAPHGGSAALSLGLAPDASGERDSLGSAALGIGLAVSSTGERGSSGSVALGLNLALTAAGSNGDVGCPVSPFPFTLRAGSVLPWAPRAVRSFPEGECT